MTLLGSLQNFAGWDGVSDITNEGTAKVIVNRKDVPGKCFAVYYSGYGGNSNALLQTK